ncbi:hypothetical protein [Enterobacter ludwigii]|uniref:hypothetical protein n=1 Tax=Enterobacter ludwigii TaxID=299767 RepID=UPI0013D026AB|nr:hypothetical protein [Enterobacter ludwigii]
MKLFIANCSRQTHNFTYKLPERTQQYGQPLRAGEQIIIENNADVIHHIIDQHKPYGFLPADKMNKTFSGICYSIDKEIDFSRFKDGADQKTENLENLSKDILAASALALDQTIDNEVMKTGLVNAPSENGVEIEITGEAVNKDQDNAPSFNTTVKVEKKK